MPAFFFIDSYIPFINHSRKEPLWLIYTRALVATVGVGLLLYTLVRGGYNIAGKEIHTSSSADSSLLPQDSTWMTPNLRICVRGNGDNDADIGGYYIASKDTDDAIDVPFLQNKVQFTLNCTADGDDCTNTLTPLAGYTHRQFDRNISWSADEDVYYPYWRNGYCYHFSSANLNDNSAAVVFDLYLTGNSSINTWNGDFYFDVALFDPRFDPMEVVYTLPNRNYTQANIKDIGTELDDFLYDDMHTSIPNNYFFDIGVAQSFVYTPRYYQKMQNNPWNLIGMEPLMNKFWTLDIQTTDAIITPGAQCTLKITPNSQGNAPISTTIEDRVYTLIGLLSSTYVLYIAATNIIFHIFGLYGKNDGIAYIFVDQEPKKKFVKDNFGDIDTIPFSYVPDSDKPSENTIVPNPQTFDNDTLTRRILNLETVLAEYYIDVNKFHKHSKDDDQPDRPLTMTEKIKTFVKGAVDEKDDFVEVGGAAKDFTDNLGDIEKGLKF